MTTHLTQTQFQQINTICVNRAAQATQIETGPLQALANSGLSISQLPPQVCTPGQIVCREGDPGSTMYLIRSGHAAILKGDFDTPVVLACRGPGEFVGEMALLENRPRSASVVALDELQLYPISYEDFQTALEHSPNLDVGLLRHLSSRLRESDELITTRTQASRTLVSQVSELEAVNLQLQAAERLRAETTDLVIHDLRNPLHGIIGAAGLLQMVLAPSVLQENRDLFDLLNNNCVRLERLVNSLLDISRIESGEIELVRQPSDVGELMRAAVERLTGTLHKRSLTCHLHLPPTRPWPWLDQDMIDRVIVNLLDNAIKFTPDGGVISLTAQVQANQVIVTVTDTGRGIPPELRDHIFERFARAADPGSSLQRGFGLGLTFCRLAVAAHGGRIWVEDGDDGKGCKFLFTLPLEQTSAAPLILNE